MTEPKNDCWYIKHDATVISKVAFSKPVTAAEAKVLFDNVDDIDDILEQDIAEYGDTLEVY